MSGGPARPRPLNGQIRGVVLRNFALLLFLGALMPVSASGQLPDTIDLASGEEDVTIFGATAGDSLTNSGALAVGDFNADGTDDLVLGALLADGPSDARLEAGEAYIYFGAGALASTLDIAGLAGTAPDVTIFGATAVDRLTEHGTLAVGDFNGDGTDDLVLGAQSADGPADGRNAAGEAYIIYGSAGLPATIEAKLSRGGLFKQRRRNRKKSAYSKLSTIHTIALV